MSAVTRFKQSVSHGKERKAHQPLPASAWATPRSVLTCIPYICFVTPSALWCRTSPEAMEHFRLQCSRLLSQHTVLRSWLSALAITTLDLPTLLAASGVQPSWQPAVLRLTCAFLRKTGQLPCL
ncbi:hypothetical protein E2C01_085305 [Portunus trituberculatus]|uniref:Uncharacterized protein n=1 Tax=Portunus trituberculatus TaxID=210409 RepID=A0A5B7JBK5_PORTR|nr:hypothetical protein [Portunus trituberculatus]